MTDTIQYKLGRKTNLWAAFEPVLDGLRPTWQIAVSARNRGGSKVLAPLMETSVLRPLATVRVKGEAYPLTIDWHELRRGGQLCLGGARKLGLDGAEMEWEMRWLPLPGAEGAFQVEMRLRTTPRRTGSLTIELASVLHQPEVWRLQAASALGHQALSAVSAYHGHAVSVVALSGEGSWSEQGGFVLEYPSFSLGGGKLISFSLRFGAAKESGSARASLISQYTAFAGASLHLLDSVLALDPAETVARLTAPEAYHVQGMERLYLKTPSPEPSLSDAEPFKDESFYGGWPQEPAGALAALWDWNGLHATPGIPRLVRFGAHGLCADFQVMGRAGESESNKGAFWDKLTQGIGTDLADGSTHGLLSNARLARSLFRLHEVTGEPLLKQSAINIGHWLMLKQNERGFYDGARVHGTRGLEGDGRFVPSPCALDGAEAIRAFVAAYGATGNEVWIKAAWRVAEFLLNGRLREFDAQPPAAIAGVVLSLLALDAESPNVRLRSALTEWGAWLLSHSLSPETASLNPDGLHAGLYDCAQAGFRLFGLTRSITYLRYAFAALRAVPEPSHAAAWRAVAGHQSALLSLAGLLPEAVLNFDAPSVALDRRVFTPDPAAAPFLKIQPANGTDTPIDYLPLVCRGTDQLLLLMLAPPSVEAVTVAKNGKRPLLRDLRTGQLDTEAPLAFVSGKERWARVGLFTVDP
ncbi:MAG: hypothetical protein ACRYFS_18145 [Janthinobacterium lividum]